MRVLATSISFTRAPTTVRMDSGIGRSPTTNECLQFCQGTATTTVPLPRHNITVLWKWIFLGTIHGFASIRMMCLHNIRTTLLLPMIAQQKKYGLFTTPSDGLSPTPSLMPLMDNTRVVRTCIRIPPPQALRSNVVKQDSKCVASK